jgi:hypothetical protein
MASLSELIARHGYWIVAAAIGIESMGIPVPGETILVTAAIYAGATHQLNIVTVIVGSDHRGNRRRQRRIRDRPAIRISAVVAPRPSVQVDGLAHQARAVSLSPPWRQSRFLR